MIIKLLIADDSTLVRKNIKRLLQNITSLSIIESTTAKSTINKIEEYNPDILLLDLRMPEGSGYDVLKYLRDKTIKPVIIVLTNSSDGLSRKKCFEDGCDYFFDKAKEHKDAVRLVKEFVNGLNKSKAAPVDY